jgi:hypothetical protein
MEYRVHTAVYMEFLTERVTWYGENGQNAHPATSQSVYPVYSSDINISNQHLYHHDALLRIP